MQLAASSPMYLPGTTGATGHKLVVGMSRPGWWVLRDDQERNAQIMLYTNIVSWVLLRFLVAVRGMSLFFIANSPGLKELQNRFVRVRLESNQA